MTKTLDQHTDDWVENYSNLVAEGAISTGINAGRDFFDRENLQAARYSAILDTKVCAYCRSLDGKTIRLDHPSYVSGEYDPPAHQFCRCVWVYVAKKEKDIPFDWQDPPPELREKHASWNQELPWQLKYELGKLEKAIKSMAKEDLKAIPQKVEIPLPEVKKRKGPEELPVPGAPAWENNEYRRLQGEARELLEKPLKNAFALNKLENIQNWDNTIRQDYFNAIHTTMAQMAESRGWKAGKDFFTDSQLEAIWIKSASKSTEAKLLHIAMNRLSGRDDWAGIHRAEKWKLELGDLTQHEKAIKATQNSLLLRKAISQTVFESAGMNELTLYRGTHDKQGLLKQLKSGGSRDIGFNPLSSWTTAGDKAKFYANQYGHKGTVLSRGIPIKDVWTSYFTSSAQFYDGYREVVVALPERALVVKQQKQYIVIREGEPIPKMKAPKAPKIAEPTVDPPYKSTPEYQELRGLVDKHFDAHFAGVDLTQLKSLNKWAWDERTQYYNALDKLEDAVLRDTTISGLSKSMLTRYQSSWISSSVNLFSQRAHVAVNQLWGRVGAAGTNFGQPSSAEIMEARNAVLLDKAISDQIFEKAGITKIKVRRGTRDSNGYFRKGAPNEGDVTVTIPLRPLSSFSTSLKTAAAFGNVVMEMDVPVNSIWWNWYTNKEFLSAKEFEVVVGGREIEYTFERISEANKRYPKYGLGKKSKTP